MVAGWTFDEPTGPVVDQLGPHTFTLASGTVRTVDGGGRTGAMGDRGLTQQFETTQTAPMPSTAPQRTIACWVSMSALPTAGWLLEVKNDALDTGVFGFLCLAGSLRLRAKDPSNSPADLFAPALSTGTWHHLCGSYDGQTLRLFVDGALGGRELEFAGPIWVPDTATFFLFDHAGSTITIDDAQVLDHAVTTEAAALALMTSPIGVAARTDRLLAFFP